MLETNEKKTDGSISSTDFGEDECNDCDIYVDTKIIKKEVFKEKHIIDKTDYSPSDMFETLKAKMMRFSEKIKTKTKENKHLKDGRTYTIYRAPFSGNMGGYCRSKTKGMLIGAIDGLITGCSNGAKWCGAGGWFVGGVATLVGFIAGGFSGFFTGGIYGGCKS